MQTKATRQAVAVLAVSAAVNLTIQSLWVGYSPVLEATQSYYGISETAAGWFAMSFQAVFIPLSIPASALIDRHGVRVSVGAASVITGLAALARGLVGPQFVPAMLATIVLAICQPFFLNAWTTTAAHWFAPGRRATAVSVITLGNLMGVAVAMAAGPSLVDAVGVGGTQTVYGALALAFGIAFVLVYRNDPAVPVEDADGVRALSTQGLRHALSVPAFRRLLLMAFMGVGAFNAVATWVAAMVAPHGFGPQEAGNVGTILLLSGLVGAVVLSAWADRSGMRVGLLVISLALAVPALLGLVLLYGWAVYAAAAFLGFFLTATMPVGMQYAAEITRPVPEATSNGLVQLAGGVSVVLIFPMQLAAAAAGGSFVVPVALLAGAIVVCIALLVVFDLRRPAGKGR